MQIVLAYHGCSTDTAHDLLSGSYFKLSNRPYDWLGQGAYFWEADALRAYQWAIERRPESPCVVGAAIDLGNCLDLTTQRGIQAIKLAYSSYVKLQELAHKSLPVNVDAKNSKPGDLVLRHLDRAVVDHLHEIYKAASEADSGTTKEFDTVRAMFPEGQPAYPTAGFREKTHVQIAVRSPKQVLGIFRMPAHQLDELGLPDVYASLK